ncbi:MAG: bifunctional demethylmenaquinone methyltransferase/2-methoxy-6-polyprenyl-1,4-benzoquinol methylase UbiE [Proteobacteria bacterium]|nr:bifunctional demethylmenaquinone methyltransferase/2-methoxy-6-polyprenyl-1,4-benzoquinol methylase UbiE [Pseudomonadota bacterium]
MSPQVVAKKVQQMFGSIAARYDVTNSVLSFGVHHLWKRLVVNALPRSATARILDLCTGTGDLLPLLRRRFQTVIGADFSLPMLEVGKSRSGHREFALVQGDALGLPFPARCFDGVTVAFGVRNLESLAAGLTEIARVLRPGGTLVVLEFGQPPGRIFGSLYGLYSRWIMPTIGGLLTGNRDAYTYLPETAAAFPCGAHFAEIMQRCGFEQPTVRSLTFGIAYLYSARVRGA